MVQGAEGDIFDPEFEAWRNESRAFDQLTCWARDEFDFAGHGSPERLLAASVPANFLAALRISPAFGHNFSQKEDLPNGPRAVILTDSFWRRHFSSNPAVIGQNIRLNSVGYTIVGILPASFHFPGGFEPEALVPIQLPTKPNWDAPGLRGFQVIGRLRAGVTTERAKADLHLITKRQEPSMPAYFRSVRRNVRPLQLTPLQTFLAGDTRWTLLLLSAAVVLLLGIACANVINLQLSRAAARQNELALRAALGAGRGRLARFLLTESLLVALAGGGCGILLAWSFVRLLGSNTLLPLISVGLLHIDKTVLLFTVFVALMTGLACGLLPALFASKPVLHTAIKGGEARLFGLGTRFRGFVVVSEIALTLLLLVGAFLLFRSLQQVLAIHPGFQPDHVLSFQTNLPDASHRKTAELVLTLQAELERIAALPGVQSVGMNSPLLLTRNIWSSTIAIEGQPAVPSYQRPSVTTASVSPNYFRTMRIPLISGRDFSRTDSSHAPSVALVNISFVRRFFGNADPLGKRFHYGGSSSPWTTIVGMVSDTHDQGPEVTLRPEFYLPVSQSPDSTNSRLGIVLRTTLPASTLLPAIRRQIAKIDSAQPIFDIATMDQRLSASTAPRRTQTALLSSFAIIALCLASIGVYGVLSYAVTQRTREIGIRMALGAQKATVLRSVVRRGILLASGGIVIGLAVSLATMRYLASFLYHVKPLDWISFTAAAIVILVLAILASYLPARRAANVDPMTALRHE